MVVFLWALRIQSTHSIQFSSVLTTTSSYFFWYNLSLSERREREEKREFLMSGIWRALTQERRVLLTFLNINYDFLTPNPPKSLLFFLLFSGSRILKIFLLALVNLSLFCWLHPELKVPNFLRQAGRQAGRKFLLADVFVRNLTIKVLSLQFMHHRTVGCWGFLELQHNFFVFFFHENWDTHSSGSEILGPSLFLALRFFDKHPTSKRSCQNTQL